MTRRAAACAALALLLLAACREERVKPTFSSEDLALLRKKTDEKITVIVTENLPALFAGVVVFTSDVFMTQSAFLERAGIPVIEMIDNDAILLLNSPDLPLLIGNPQVKKIHYLCRQGALARLHPTLEMDIVKRFGQGREEEPISLFVRFGEAPKEEDVKYLDGAGFTVDSRAGYVWVVSGALKSLHHLLAYDRITYFEGASKAKGM